VEFTELGNGEVACKSGHEIYKLEIQSKKKTCTCKGFYFNGYRQKGFMCKHLKEYEIYKEEKLCQK